ncbi:MAG: phospholipid carrier-dependent glycosyltransferase, partial [Verrucomicrobia bacterium]
TASRMAVIGVTSLSTVLMFLLGRRLMDARYAVAAAVTFALMTAGNSVLGLAGHANHFVVVFTLLGLWCLLNWDEKRNARWAFFSGLALSLAVLMKQHAAVFIIFGGVWLTVRAFTKFLPEEKNGWRHLLFFAAGCACPLLITAILLGAAGVLDRMWLWTFKYAAQYATLTPLHIAPGLFVTAFARVIEPFLPLWLLGGAGFLSALLARNSGPRRWFILGFGLAGFAFVCPGLVFRNQYFIGALPALALSVGVAWQASERWLARRPQWQGLSLLPLSLVLLALACGVASEWTAWVELPPRKLAWKNYWGNPFNEVPVLADYIRQHSGPRETLAVLGSEPQAYFYAQRRAATGYLYTYPLMEDQPYARRMQEEMAAQIAAAQPRFVLLVNVPVSWLVRPGADRFLFDWWSSYSPNRYEVVAVCQGNFHSPSKWFWQEAARACPPSSMPSLVLYELKTAPAAH